jgi:hypothetical protein
MAVIRTSARLATANAATIAAVAATVAAISGTVASGPEMRPLTLSATTIPIIDFNKTFGPLALSRTLTAVFDGDPTGAAAILQALGQTNWAGPLGNVLSASSAAQPMTFVSDANDALQAFLNLPASAAAVYNSPPGTQLSGGGGNQTAFSTGLLTGGPNGYGFNIASQLIREEAGGSLLQPIGSHPFGVAGSAANVVGAIAESATVLPSGGLAAVLTASPYSTPFGAQNSVSVLTGPNGGLTLGQTANIGTTDWLCLGSGYAHCNINAFAQTGNDLQSAVTLSRQLPGGGTQQLASIDLPNEIAARLEPDALTVTGQVGGVATVGSHSIGKVVPINITIPRPAASMLSATSSSRASAASTPVGAKAKPLNGLSRVKAAVSKALSSKPFHKDSDSE